MKQTTRILTLERIARGIVLGLALATSGYGFGQELHLESAGARFGLNPNGAGHDFHQAEAFVNVNLPWNCDLGSRWILQSRVDGSAGWLVESRENAGILTLGPSLALGPQSFPVAVEAGVSPTVLTRSDFATKDFGTLFQFTSHGGLNWDVTSHVRLSYRFQHMSDAGLGRHNPGLNMHMFGVSYVF